VVMRLYRMSEDDMFDNMAWRWAVVRPKWLIFLP